MRTYKANTEQEAVNLAASDFNVKVEELQYEVTEVVKSFFKSKNSVTIACKDLNDLVSDVTNYIDTILNILDIKARHSYSYDGTTDIINWMISPIKEEDCSRVIGYQGNFLRALNVLCRALISGKYNHKYRILLDCDGYKDKKYDKLERMARRIGNEVKHTQQEVHLDSMTSDERRIVHNVIARINYVESSSTGAGKFRHIVIKYNPEKVVNKRKNFRKEAEVETSEDSSNE